MMQMTLEFYKRKKFCTHLTILYILLHKDFNGYQQGSINRKIRSRESDI